MTRDQYTPAPVAYLRQKDVDTLAGMSKGAINVQIANTPFVGCTVPVYVAPPPSHSALAKALEAAILVLEDECERRGDNDASYDVPAAPALSDARAALSEPSR